MNYTYENINHQNGISVTKLSLNIGSKNLLKDTELVISKGINYGLVSPNGHGKTTLLNFISGHIKSKGGDIHMVRQENGLSNKTVIDELLSSHENYQSYLEKEKQLNETLSKLDNKEQILDITEKLKKLNDWAICNKLNTIESKAKKILAGLGFEQNTPTGNMQNKMITEYSGGWRMRVSISKALLNEPDILILDEPTNHLDLNAVIWLGNYLTKWNTFKNTKHKTLIIVSHDKDFLDSVVHKILRIHNQQIIVYTGNHDKMLRMIKQERKEIEKKWNKDKKHIKSKKDRKNKRPDRIYEVDFSFSEDVSSKGHITLDNITFSYNDVENVFENIDFCIRAGEKISIVGSNGSGKSTLLNILCNELELSKGSRRTDNIKIAKYSQHFENSLPMDLTPVEYLQQVYSNWNTTDIRKHLSQYNLDSKAHNIPIKNCSGGQKSRIVFSTLSEASILVLDEPTNHLDMESITALTNALENFEGGVVLVSHDAKLISELECDLYICENKKLTKYSGDFEDYKEQLIENIEE
jgi:ATP-binding cassette subfamily F protein 1